MTDESLSFLSRLKQHHVYRVVVGYAVAAWIVIQVTSRVFPYFGWNHFVPAIIIILLLGFPVVLILAWLLVKPRGPAVSNSWLRRHGAFGATLSAVVVVLVVISGFYALRFSEHYEQRMMVVTTTQTVSKTAVAVSSPALVAVTVIPAKSIAVLPFENLSTDKANAYFADGMQDLILTKLADIGGLKVIARTSTMQYGSHPQNLTKIGRELGVATLLEGSVQKAGNQVLINVQLIDAKTDSHLWAESYTRTLDNIFGVEGDVASKVADALKTTLTPKETRAVASAPTTNPEAYTLFLKAKYQIDQFYQGNAQPELAEKAIAYLQHAIQHDPQFALAYALQAKMQIGLVINQMRDTLKLRDGAWTNVHKALSLEPDLAEAHKVLGVVLMSRGEVAQGQAQLQIAQRLAPNDSRIPELLAENASFQGNWTQAAVEIAQALRLDPRNTHHYQWASRIDMALRRYGAAIRTAQQGVAINPQDTSTRLQLASALMSSGQLQAAGEQFMVVANQIPIGKLSLGVYYLFIRDYAAALKVAQAMPADTRMAYSYVGIRELVLAQAHLGLGQQAQGQALLDQAHDLVTAALRAHPNSDSLYGTLATIEMWRGNRDAALQAVDKAYALVSSATSSAFAYPSDYVENKATILAHFGDAPDATALLNKLMETPGTGETISPALLRLDPAWDPIRKDPRFQALLNKYSNATPAPEAGSGG